MPLTDELEEWWFDAQVKVLKAFESEPLRSMPSLKRRVLEDRIFACPLTAVEDDGTSYTFIIFDFERIVDNPIDHEKLFYMLHSYKVDLQKDYERFIDKDRVLN